MIRLSDVFYGMETELKDKPKSTIGRAAVGGLLFASAGAIVGAISAGNKKQVKERQYRQ